MSKQPLNKWTNLASTEILNITCEALKKRGINVVIVEDKSQAFQKLVELIPPKAEVMTGSSTTLSQIGFMPYYLSDKPSWKRLGPEVYLEKDPEKQMTLRRKSDTAEYFIGSVNALSEDGILVAVDNSGSRVSAYPFAAKKVILVVGTQKITPTLDDAMRRIREYVFPLENERAKKAYGVGTRFGKWVIIENENQKDRITLIFVKEVLGF